MNHYKWKTHSDGTRNIVQCGFKSTSKYYALGECDKPGHTHEKTEIVEQMGSCEVHIIGCETCVQNKLNDLKNPITPTHHVRVVGNEPWRTIQRQQD